MKKVLALMCIILFFFSSRSEAQAFLQKYLVIPAIIDIGTMTKTNDGGYAIVGTVPDTSSNFIHWGSLLKLDSAFNIMWHREYNMTPMTSYDLEFNQVISTSDGGFLIGGDAIYSTGSHAMALKIDSIGNVQWFRPLAFLNYNNSWTNAIEQLNNGDFILSGRIYSVAEDDFFVAYVRANGTVKWNRGYREGGTVYPFDILELHDSNILVVAQGADGNYTINLDTSGNYNWVRGYYFGNSSRSTKVVEDSNGNLIHCGSVSVGLTGYGLLLKTDSLGVLIWARKYDSPTQFFDMEMTSNNNLLLLGKRYESIVMLTDTIGNILWKKQNGSSLNEQVKNMVLITDTSFVVMSSINTSPNPDFIYLMYSDTNITQCFDSSFNSTLSGGPSYLWSINAPAIESSANTTPPVLTSTVYIGFHDSLLCSITTNLQQVFSDNYTLSLSPNPATSELIVNSLKLKVESVEVFDVMGKKMIEHLILNPSPSGEGLRFDVSSLSAGIYFVKLRGEKQERVAKFVKQ